MYVAVFIAITIIYFEETPDSRLVNFSNNQLDVVFRVISRVKGRGTAISSF